MYGQGAMDECHRRIGGKVVYCKDMYEAALEADALLLVTEWKEFRMPSLGVLAKTMNERVVIDGRNIYDSEELTEKGFTYYKIG